jgi:hypothetical protein
MTNQAVRFILSLSMVAVASAATTAHAADEWKTLTSEKGAFTISMPGTPTESQQTYDTDAGPVTATLYMLELDGGNVAYLAGFNDFDKKQVAGKDPQDMLDGARDGAVANVQGTLVKETKITLDGNPGREILVQAPGDMLVYARVYLVKNRLLQALVVMPKKTLKEGDVTKFLTSITLLKKKAK